MTQAASSLLASRRDQPTDPVRPDPAFTAASSGGLFDYSAGLIGCHASAGAESRPNDHIDSFSATFRIWTPCTSEAPPRMAQATWTASVISSMFDPFSRQA